MADFYTLDRRNLAFAVVITGIPRRFCSHVCPGDTLDAGMLWVVGAELRRPTDVLAVLSVGPRSAHIDDLKAVAEQEPVEVRIQARDARTSTGALVHPIHDFGRVGGPQSAERAVRLAASLPHAETGAGLVDIQVSKSCAAWTLPGAVHIGQEVIWVDSAETREVDGVDTFWLTDCYRGADGWATQEHPVSPRDYEEPWVTSEVTTWQGRWAQIWCAALGGSGAPLVWAPYWQGVVMRPPAIKGDVITVEIAPYTAVMDYRIGVGSASRTAQTVNRWHRVVGGFCDLIVSREFQRVSAWIDSTDIVNAASAADPGTWLEFSVGDWPMVAALYSEVLPDAEWWLGMVYSQRPNGIDAPNRRLLFPFSGGANLPAQFLATSPAQVGVCHLKYSPAHLALWRGLASPDEVVAWPDRLEEVWNEAQAGQATASCLADPTSGGGVGRMGRFRLFASDGSAIATCADFHPESATVNDWHLGLQLDSDDPRSAWAGIVGDPTVTINAGVGARREGRAPDRANGGIGWMQIGDIVRARSELADAPQVLPLGGVPTWWLGSGELWVGPLDVDLYTAGGEAQTIHFTGGKLPEGGVNVSVVGSEAAVLPDGTTAYFLEINPAITNRELRAFGDVPLTAQVIASSIDTEPGVYLLRLLESGIGNGDNGTHDRLPIGANIPAFAIDEDSFLACGAPSALMGQDYTAVRGETIADQTEGLLLACGVKIAQVYDEASGGWRIALVRLGAVSGLASSQTITDADMKAEAGDTPVETIYDGRVVKSFKLAVNHNTAEGKREVEVPCATERNDAGADSGKPLEMDLPGVVLDGSTGTIAQAAVEIVSDARANVGVPRVRWRFTISATQAGAGARAIGDTVTVTSSFAVPLRPTGMVAGVPCRVVGIEADPESDLMDLDVRPYPGRSGGWAPSMRVLSVSNARTVKIVGAEFSADDLARFAQGDAVDCVKLGAWTTRVATTVESISAPSVTFAHDHLLAAGDVIRLRGYAAAVAARSALAGYAWLSDDDGLLPGPTAGQVIA